MIWIAPHYLQIAQWPWLGQVEVPRPIVVEKCIEVPKIQAQGLSFGKGAGTGSLPLEMQ